MVRRMPLSSFSLTVALVACCLFVPGLPMNSLGARKLHKRELSSACAITRRIIKSPEAGGVPGTGFDDRLNNNLQNQVTMDGVQSISLSYADYLESLQVTYLLSNHSSFTAPRHGILRSSEVTITLAHGEFITKIEGFHNGTVVQQITFTTVIFGTPNKTSHKYGPFGTTYGINTPFSVEGYVVGFFGRALDYGILIGIGMYALAPLSTSEEYGGLYSSPPLTRFDDKPDDYYAPTSRINLVHINHDDTVVSFKTYYNILGGDILQSDWHGSTDGNQSTISVRKDEAIIGIEGTSDGKYINHLSFITRHGDDGSVTKYGPYGKVAQSGAFSFYGNIVGFTGSFYTKLHSIGVYYT